MVVKLILENVIQNVPKFAQTSTYHLVSPVVAVLQLQNCFTGDIPISIYRGGSRRVCSYSCVCD